MPHGPRGLGDRIVAVLDDGLLAALGGRSKSVRLSPATADKQARKHPDVNPGDYRLVQVLIERGEAIVEKGPTLVLVGELAPDKWWRAVVKRTREGHGTYLVTLHRIKSNQVASARRRGVSVRSGEGGGAAPGGAQSLLAWPKPRV